MRLVPNKKLKIRGLLSVRVIRFDVEFHNARRSNLIFLTLVIDRRSVLVSKVCKFRVYVSMDEQIPRLFVECAKVANLSQFVRTADDILGHVARYERESIWARASWPTLTRWEFALSSSMYSS
jgi:hypothetical protein